MVAAGPVRKSFGALVLPPLIWTLSKRVRGAGDNCEDQTPKFSSHLCSLSYRHETWTTDNDLER